MRRSTLNVAGTTALCAAMLFTPTSSVWGQPAKVPSCFGKPATISKPGPLGVTRGTPGPDVIVAIGSGDVRAGGGDDLICKRRSVGGVVEGGPGSDRIGVWHGAIIEGGPGADVLLVVGNRHASSIVRGGFGDDTMRSRGEASFRVHFHPGPGDDLVRGMRGGEADLVNFGGAKRGVTVNLATGRAHGQGQDQLFLVDAVEGTRFDDVLNGNDRHNQLDGRGGDDIISLRGGDDRGFGDAGADRVNGGAGDDRKLGGGIGTDSIHGGSGDDKLIETDRPEPNLLAGGSGSDWCTGGYTVPPNTETGCERH